MSRHHIPSLQPANPTMDVPPIPPHAPQSTQGPGQVAGTIFLGPPPTQPLTAIETPTSNDVLCGRGVTTNRHPGNENFRGLVGCNKELYVTSTKRQKMTISRSIVEAVRSLDPAGRFLEKDVSTGLWFDIGDKKAVEKTSQALRDGAACLRKQLSEDLSDPDFLSAVFDNETKIAAGLTGGKGGGKEKGKAHKGKKAGKGHRRNYSSPGMMGGNAKAKAAKGATMAPKKQNSAEASTTPPKKTVSEPGVGSKSVSGLSQKLLQSYPPPRSSSPSQPFSRQGSGSSAPAGSGGSSAVHQRGKSAGPSFSRQLAGKANGPPSTAMFPYPQRTNSMYEAGSGYQSNNGMSPGNGPDLQRNTSFPDRLPSHNHAPCHYSYPHGQQLPSPHNSHPTHGGQARMPPGAHPYHQRAYSNGTPPLSPGSNRMHSPLGFPVSPGRVGANSHPAPPPRSPGGNYGPPGSPRGQMSPRGSMHHRGSGVPVPHHHNAPPGSPQGYRGAPVSPRRQPRSPHSWSPPYSRQTSLSPRNSYYNSNGNTGYGGYNNQNQPHNQQQQQQQQEYTPNGGGQQQQQHPGGSGGGGYSPLAVPALGGEKFSRSGHPSPTPSPVKPRARHPYSSNTSSGSSHPSFAPPPTTHNRYEERQAGGGGGGGRRPPSPRSGTPPVPPRRRSPPSQMYPTQTQSSSQSQQDKTKDEDWAPPQSSGINFRSDRPSPITTLATPSWDRNCEEGESGPTKVTPSPLKIMSEEQPSAMEEETWGKQPTPTASTSADSDDFASSIPKRTSADNDTMKTEDTSNESNDGNEQQEDDFYSSPLPFKPSSEEYVEQESLFEFPDHILSLPMSPPGPYDIEPKGDELEVMGGDSIEVIAAGECGR